MNAKNRASWARPLLAAGIAVAALTATTPGAAHAAPTQSTRALAAADNYDQKLALAVKFGHGDDFALAELADRDFVIALWNIVKDNPDFLEVRLAAETAFSASPDAVDASCAQFISTDANAAFDRDVEREKREADAKRQSDLARSTAAASIDVVADSALLSGTDADFIRLIWERVAEDVKWPKVKEAARVAREGSAEAQQTFIATGMAEAAKQDTDDRIAADEAKTEAEKAVALARAAKKLAANRIGMTVTDELLSLPDRDFIIEVWNFSVDGSEVQAAAIAATRSLDAAVWKAFIDTGVHAAKDRDIQIALDKLEAQDRSLVQGILTRAQAAGQRGLAAAARTALAGNATAVADFLRLGQYQIGPDVIQVAVTTDRVGILTSDGTAYVKEGGLDAPWVKEQTKVKQLVLAGNRIGVLRTDGIAYVKEGGLSTGWANEHTAVTQLALYGNRIGVLRTDGVFWAKEGALSAGWVKQYSAVKQIALGGTRVGALATDGSAYVKEGTLASTGWIREHTLVKQLVLDGTRIGILRTDNNGYVKTGGLSTSWGNARVGIKQIALAGTRLGYLQTTGDGTIEPNEKYIWAGSVPTGSYGLALATTRICFIGSDGAAQCNDGTDVRAPYTKFRTTANPA